MPKKQKIFNKESFKSCKGPLAGTLPGSPDTEIQVTTAQDMIDQGRPVRTQTGGLANTPPLEPAIQRNVSFGERVIYFGNAGIIMGPQRTTNEMSGEGKSGFPSDTIDIVVGFNDGGEPCNGTIVNVNAVTDAARVYVSRAVKVDTMFGIARDPNPRGPPEKALSAVVMKADNARIIGRQGIKLVTGRAQGVQGAGQKGEKNSKRGDYEQGATIDLIAGNNMSSWNLPFPEKLKPMKELVGMYIPSYQAEYNYLQPAVLGENLRISLEELVDMLESSWNAQMTINTAMMVVFNTLGKAFQAIPGGQPLGVPLDVVAKLLKSYGPDAQWSLGQQAFCWHRNFLQPNAQRYIGSNNVRIT